jgi:hypothetical protein
MGLPAVMTAWHLFLVIVTQVRLRILVRLNTPLACWVACCISTVEVQQQTVFFKPAGDCMVANCVWHKAVLQVMMHARAACDAARTESLATITDT